MGSKPLAAMGPHPSPRVIVTAVAARKMVRKRESQCDINRLYLNNYVDLEKFYTNKYTNKSLGYGCRVNAQLNWR
jgi:hypothetical protein